MLKLRFVCMGVFAALITLTAGPANAIVVTQCGPDICYEYDDAQAAVALFGLPTLGGNSIAFTPTTFRAESVNGVPGIDGVSATFLFSSVYSHDGSENKGTGGDIVSTSVFDSGDYRIINGDDVTADLFIQIVNNNNVAESAIDQAAFAASGDSGGQQLWNIMADLNPSAEFAGTANDFKLTVQNDLTAATDADGERAFIEKKFTVTTTVIPVPAAVWLFGSALGLLGWMRRKAI